jgi:hypothetical protein
MFGIDVGIVILVIIMIAVLANRSKAKKLRAAPPGSVRVEAIKAAHVNNTVAEYQRAGWTVTDQSTAKSLGSQARVTITFRKPA